MELVLESAQMDGEAWLALVASGSRCGCGSRRSGVRGLMVTPEVSRTRTRQASSWAVSPVTHTEAKLIKRTSLHGSQLVGSVAMLNHRYYRLRNLLIYG